MILYGPSKVYQNEIGMQSVMREYTIDFFLKNRWFGISLMHPDDKHDPYRSQIFCRLITDYSEILFEKISLFKKYNHLFDVNFSLELSSRSSQFNISNLLETKVLSSLFTYWEYLCKIHATIYEIDSLMSILAYICQALLEEMYFLISLITHIYHGIKLKAKQDNLLYESES